MPDFRYVDMLPKGEDETPYRLITTDGIEVVDLGVGSSSKSRRRRCGR